MTDLHEMAATVRGSATKALSAADMALALMEAQAAERQANHNELDAAFDKVWANLPKLINPRGE